MIIQDSGSGVTARVYKDGELAVKSVSLTEAESATDKEESYFIGTGIVNLTSAGESAVMYFKNNENRNVHVDSIVLTSSPSTGGAALESMIFRFYENPLSGTIIDNALDGIELNRNLGASKTIDTDTFKGQEGATVVQSSDPLPSLIAGAGRGVLNIDFTITKGKGFIISLQPTTGNTNLDCTVAIVCHLAPEL